MSASPANWIQARTLTACTDQEIEFDLWIHRGRNDNRNDTTLLSLKLCRETIRFLDYIFLQFDPLNNYITRCRVCCRLHMIIS